MATGPEHYRKAEACIGRAEMATRETGEETYWLTSAQVHAALALAAITAEASFHRMPGSFVKRWQDVGVIPELATE